ncbi:MAG: alpha-glucan family phosphorylase [Candidatus Bathyarchaeota archaeon]|nr:alpha-glucan family phosphorylase [Candidatus Bathyarchaeota archaeon]
MTAEGYSETRLSVIPPRIGRLFELANNLWWSWNEGGRQVFRSLDYALWRTSGHNPVKQLRTIDPQRLEAAARDPAFLELYDAVMQEFDAEMSRPPQWCGQTSPDVPKGPIAYFSAEYAIHNSLPIYAGGLGVLAGDICKECSDRSLPLVAVGFMYPQGYFRQRISAEGEQQEDYLQIDFNDAPISPCAWPYGCGPLIPIDLADRQVYVKVWQVRVGRVNLYLLDTNVEENTEADRTLSARLYTADQEERLRQLIVLGVGGARTLRELHIEPVVWHANEDHTAFMMLERLRLERAQGASLEQAIENVRSCTVFTTHTPVPAGHHVFSLYLMDRYSRNLWEPLGIDRGTFARLGQYPGLDNDRFNLTAFAFRLSSRSNAVSKLHGEVTRRMWQVLWPRKTAEEVPILSITNGVHLPAWQAPEIGALCEKYLSPDMHKRQDSQEYWDCIDSVPEQALWQLRQTLKSRMMLTVQDRAQRRWTHGSAAPQQLTAMGTMLDPYALTIGYARRFTEYKRPYLLLADMERLKRIITNPERPVQIIFAGKSHPADYQSKLLLKRVYEVALDRGFQGRIAFIEDYDLNLSRDLVRGVDVWLNTPKRLQEASGTSGMKASLNGVVNFSVLDGWWAEAYNGKNGWAIGDFTVPREEEDRSDAESLYSQLENQITALYYERDRRGIPNGWISAVKEAIKTVTPRFNTCRMMKEYTTQMYLPASKQANPSPEENE